MSDGPASTAARAIAGALVRHLVTMVGTALVARGIVDQQTADTAASPIADYLLGAGLVLSSGAWAGIRARAAHWRWIRALHAPALLRPDSDPDLVATQGTPMSILSTLKRIVGSPIGKTVVAIAVSEFDQAIVAAKKTEIGKVMADAINAAEKPGVSGSAKREQVIAAVVPAIVLYVAGGGLAPLLADAETFARALLESTLADMKRTGPAAIAAMVLQLASPKAASA